MAKFYLQLKNGQILFAAKKVYSERAFLTAALIAFDERVA